MRKRTIALIALTSALIGSVMGVGAVQVWDSGGDNGVPAVSTATSPTSTDNEPAQGTSLVADCLTAAAVYEQVRPAVVEVTSTVRPRGPFGPQGSGTGTGPVTGAAGHILPIRGGVAEASSAEVRFQDGSTASA